VGNYKFIITLGERIKSNVKNIEYGKNISRGEKLVKYDVSEESLLKYHNQGWHFFIRTVAERRYITIRRKGKERSLGPYSDEIWKLIQGIDNREAREDATRILSNKMKSPKSLTQPRVISETEDPFLKTLEEIKRYILEYNFYKCLQINADGFCDYWRLEEPPEYEKQLNQKESEFLFKKVKQEHGKTTVWILKPLPAICNNCPAYIDEKMINFIKSRKG